MRFAITRLITFFNTVVQVTDYNHIFARLTETFEYSFRQEGRRSLIVYTNGNQHDAIDYDEIK